MATLTDKQAELFRDKLAHKYLGVDEYPYLQPGERRVIVAVTPEKIDAQGVD